MLGMAGSLTGALMFLCCDWKMGFNERRKQYAGFVQDHF